MPDDKRMSVSYVDEAHRAIHLTIDGCPVTVTCAKQDNPEVGETVKHILSGFMLDKGTASQKFDK